MILWMQAVMRDSDRTCEVVRHIYIACLMNVAGNDVCTL